MAQTEIEVSIGGRAVTYQLFETNAPKAYDHGGTLELYEGGGQRFILVPAEQADYQKGRNGSGLHTFIASSDIPAGAIADQLWGRVTA